MSHEVSKKWETEGLRRELAYLVCTELWTLTLSPLELGMEMHACNTSNTGQREART